MRPDRGLHRLRYFVADAWDEWRHNPGVNLLALATLASTLFLAGLVVLVLSNVDQRVRALRDDVRVQVYLRDGLSDEDRRSLEQELSALDGVERVEHVDKQEALRRYREWAGEVAELVHELEFNPLPASLEIVLAPSRADGIVEAILLHLQDEAGVEEVRFNRDWLRRLESLLRLARRGGTALAVLVFGAVAFIMAGVLRLAVHARRDEIEIMQLVGASPAFIRGPFLVAGVWHGLLASLVALSLVEALRRATVSYAGTGFSLLVDLVAARPLMPNLTALLVALGLAVSLLGSYLAVGVRSHMLKCET